MDCWRYFVIRMSNGETRVTEPVEEASMAREELSAHLAAFPKERLVEEVLSMWHEFGEVERELAMARQRARSLDGELTQTRS